jgi:DNA-directed RNA polymerase subunit RPC12/RpoP
MNTREKQPQVYKYSVINKAFTCVNCKAQVTLNSQGTSFKCPECATLNLVPIDCPGCDHIYGVEDGNAVECPKCQSRITWDSSESFKGKKNYLVIIIRILYGKIFLNHFEREKAKKQLSAPLKQQLKKFNENKLFYIFLPILFFSPIWSFWIWQELPDNLIPDITTLQHITILCWVIPFIMIFGSVGDSGTTRTKTGRSFESESGEIFNEYKTERFSQPDNYIIGFEFGVILIFHWFIALILTIIWII